jgi:hypothetical protein
MNAAQGWGAGFRIWHIRDAHRSSLGDCSSDTSSLAYRHASRRSHGGPRRATPCHAGRGATRGRARRRMLGRVRPAWCRTCRTGVLCGRRRSGSSGSSGRRIQGTRASEAQHASRACFGRRQFPEQAGAAPGAAGAGAGGGRPRRMDGARKAAGGTKGVRRRAS